MIVARDGGKMSLLLAIFLLKVSEQKRNLFAYAEVMSLENFLTSK